MKKKYWYIVILAFVTGVACGYLSHSSNDESLLVDLSSKDSKRFYNASISFIEGNSIHWKLFWNGFLGYDAESPVLSQSEQIKIIEHLSNSFVLTEMPFCIASKSSRNDGVIAHELVELQNNYYINSFLFAVKQIVCSLEYPGSTTESLIQRQQYLNKVLFHNTWEGESIDISFREACLDQLDLLGVPITPSWMPKLNISKAVSPRKQKEEAMQQGIK